MESKEYHNDVPSSADSRKKSLSDEHDDVPRVAIRRYTDRCFFEVEEIVPGGYIVEGFMIDQDDVAEVISLGVDGVPLPPCTLADTDEMTGPPGLDSE